MISVCLAAYNGERYITQQIDSILIQLGEQDELIVSDDGSTDTTCVLVQAYQDPRIKLIKGPQEGVIRNVEHLLSHACGELIFLADQDDIWKENKIERMRAIFSQHPDIDVVVSDLTIVDEQEQILYPSYFHYRKVKAGFYRNILKNSFIGAGMAMRKSLLDQALPFPKNIPMHDMWLGLVARNRVYFLSEPLVYYRRHEQNASEIQTTSSSKQKLIWRYNLINALISRLIFKK
ncbi:MULTISPECIES: glycosyltransferase family 2 protein [Enterococcus]|uniref:Glycosyltransferase 2-like domain-containing protein n=1 Tax=Enterococcus sulfureus ATCC 49903 TaxID=1140003 RepID=S0P6I7_9ENTE|nr:glycosyltransferase family 2 protein [Enterococcus sulfureus]EOT48048.1 hypothetical protein OMY_00856 [Enterococcus sulfureus ATCC 49903]EOT84096.1 hypothetical protein I573_01822 [Enterococcus sulfureus ATCC 49903]